MTKRVVGKSKFDGTKPRQTAGPKPTITFGPPGVTDRLEKGTLWVDQDALTSYILCGYIDGDAQWVTSPSGGTTTTTLTIDPGDLIVTDGDVDIQMGDLDVAGATTLGTLAADDTVLSNTLTVNGDATFNANVSITGNFVVTGDFDITDAASVSITSTNDAAGAITLLANGGTASSIILQTQTGTAADAIKLFAVAGGITLTAARANAAAIVLEATDAVGGLVSSVGTGGYEFVAANGDFIVDTGTGAILLGTDAVSHAIDIGNSTGATLVRVRAGGAGLELGANAIAHPITIGNGTGATVVTIDSGTGGVEISTNAVAQPVVIGNGTGATSVTIDAGTAGISIGANAIAHTVAIGNATGATAVQITAGTGASGFVTTGAGTLVINTDTGTLSISNNAAATTVNIATGAGDKQVTIGSVTGGSDVTILGGTGPSGWATTNGNLTFNSGTGIITISDSATATTLNIGTGAGAKTVTLGSTNTTSTTTLQAGSGGIVLSAAGIVTMVPATDTQASPSAASTVNANVGVLTFTGFTTASTASQVFTITNSKIAVTSGIFVSAHNEGSNDAQMTVTRIKAAAGSMEVTLTNNGAAALNGNVLISFWVVS